MTRRKFFNLIPAIFAGAATFALWPRKASGMFPCRIEKTGGVMGDAKARPAVEVVRVTKDDCDTFLYPWDERFELIGPYHERGYRVSFTGMGAYTTDDGRLSFKQALVRAWPAPEGISPLELKYARMCTDLYRAGEDAKRAIAAIKLEAVA